MFKRIKVQGKLNLPLVIFISVMVVLIAFLFLYIGITSDFVSSRTKSEIFGFIALIAIFIPIWLKNATSEEEYVSELILDDNSLKILYKGKNSEHTEEILLNDIRSVDVLLNANNVRTGKSTSLFCETIVTISIKSGEEISFTENPTASFSFCSYAFMLRLLDIARYLPNFRYEVEGNSEVAKLDVQNYAQYGKRLPFLKREYIAFKRYPVWARIILFCCFTAFIGCMGLLIYLNFPSFLNSADKEYISYIENGYKYYQDDLYDKSLSEYSKALNIHDDDSTLYYYRALSYYYNKQYEKTIQEAQKGISVLDKKSLYHNAKKWRFAKNDIGLYTTLGDAERKLGNYQNAIKAYDYVVENVKYTYTDVYFQRGKCKYYLNEKPSALSDFFKHKNIIEQYLYDQSQSEYKALYPTYTSEDLDRISKWIEACHR